MRAAHYAAAIAGVRRLKFVALDLVGESLFVGGAVILGVLFKSAITAFIITRTNLGAIGLALVGGALPIYILARW